MRPNLFNYAKSELSQDAFISWLAEWSDSKYALENPNLHSLGQAFIKSLFDKAEKHPPDYDSVRIPKSQKFNIDVYIELLKNETPVHSIIIEDKIHAGIYNPLINYREKIIEHEGYNADDILCILLKTGFQSNYKSSIEKGYVPYLLDDFLEILKIGNGINNEILKDFTAVLQQRHDNIKKFETKPVDDWTNYDWIGLFLKLQEELKDGDWSWVDNRNGGFWAFWYSWKEIKNNPFQLYAQIESKSNKSTVLTVRMWFSEKKYNKELRQKAYDLIIRKSQEAKIKIRRPDRFGSGKTVTIGIYDDEILKFTDNRLEINTLLSVMNEVAFLINSITSE